MTVRWLLIAALVLLVAMSFFFLREGSSGVEEICIKACKDALKKGINLEDGPCLLDPIPEAPDWVCDVAHSPRQPVDNDPANQCSSYLTGNSHHFVEVDPNCRLIRMR